MKISRIVVIFCLVLAGSLCFASEEEGEFLLAHLEGIQLSLGGAPYYYWLTPEKGRVVLKKQCVPAPEDCDHNILEVWDESGSKLYERAPHLDIPEMSGSTVMASTLLTPDRLVFSTVVKRETYSWVLAQYIIDDGSLAYVVPTSPIQCLDLHGDNRGTIWCLGHDHARRADDQDYDLVYRFDHSGTLLTSALPRSTYPESSNPIRDVPIVSGVGGFLPGNGEVRLWLPVVGELISFDENGDVKHRLVLPTLEDQVHSWLVSAPDYEIYAELVQATDPQDQRSTTWALYRLAPDGSSWIPLQDPPVHLPPRIRLEGVDDSGLILLDRESFELLWYPLDSGSEEVGD